MKQHFIQQMPWQLLCDLGRINLGMCVDFPQSFGTESLFVSPTLGAFKKMDPEKYLSWPFEPHPSSTAHHPSGNCNICSHFRQWLRLPAEMPLPPSSGLSLHPLTPHSQVCAEGAPSQLTAHSKQPPTAPHSK